MDVWLLYGQVQVQAPSPFATKEALRGDQHKITVFAGVAEDSVIELLPKVGDTEVPDTENRRVTLGELRAWLRARAVASEPPPAITEVPLPEAGAPTQIEGEN